MTTNYSTLTNDELDRVSAERFGIDVTTNVVDGPLFIDGDVLKFFWNPTHPDSNQCERYLFPPIEDCHIGIVTQFRESCFNICMVFDGEDAVVQTTTELDLINRTKTISCLMALDKLEEVSENNCKQCQKENIFPSPVNSLYCDGCYESLQSIQDFEKSFGEGGE